MAKINEEMSELLGTKLTIGGDSQDGKIFTLDFRDFYMNDIQEIGNGEIADIGKSDFKNKGFGKIKFRIFVGT